MKNRFKACIKTNKTFVVDINGNQEYLLQEVQHCYTKKERKKKKKKKKHCLVI